MHIKPNDWWNTQTWRTRSIAVIAALFLIGGAVYMAAMFSGLPPSGASDTTITGPAPE